MKKGITTVNKKLMDMTTTGLEVVILNLFCQEIFIEE